MTTILSLVEKLADKTSFEGFTIRKMERSDLNIAIEWATKEGWNPGLNDAEIFYKVDPDGYFIGELKGTPIACISAIAYDCNYGFVGFFIVKPEYRGNQYGLALIAKAYKYMGNRNIGLDGVLAKQNQYKQIGFEFYYKNKRYEGIAKKSGYSNLIKLDEIPIESVIEYDKRMFPARREQFIKEWVSQPNCHSIGYVSNKELIGYGVIRKCVVGYKIGPLFANNPIIAENIYNALTSNVIGEKIYLDVPENNIDAIALANNNNMKIVFETARMYSKQLPNIDNKCIYGVTTFELG